MTPGRTSVLRGAVLTVGMRWTDRAIGILSTLILARLLVPEDIGIVAMSSLVIALADMLLDLGVAAALIQNKKATREHFDTAWTIRLLQMSASALLAVIAAPFASVYFGEPRVAPVLQVSAIGLFLAGLENIGVVAFQKDMRFGSDFRFTFLKRIVAFAITMIAAFILRNYWALILGALAGRAFGVILSYTMHPFRPRLSFARGREVFGFSQWMLIRGIGSYLDGALHKFVVGGREGASVMGGYSIGAQIAGMPSTELLMPLNRVLFPRFVHAKEDKAELKRVFLLAQGVQTLLAVPVSIGLALVAKDAVPVLLGDKWLLAVPFLQLFALAHVVRALTTSSHYVLLTLGKPASVAALAWVKVAVFSAIVFVAIPHGDARQVAVAQVVTVFAGIGVSFWLLRRALPVVRWRDLGASTIRPLLSLLPMAIAILGVDHYLAGPAVVDLAVKVPLGGVVYSVSLLLLWRLAGKPDGAESYLLQTFRAAAVRLWARDRPAA